MKRANKVSTYFFHDLYNNCWANITLPFFSTVNFLQLLHKGPLLVDDTWITQIGAEVSLYVHCDPNPRPHDICCKTISDFIAELNLINYLIPLVYHICKIRADIRVL